QQAETWYVGRLGAALEEELEAEADPEQRHPGLDPATQHAVPGVVECGRGVEVAHAGHDRRRGAVEILRCGRREELRADGRQRLPHGRQIARLVVDERDHVRAAPWYSAAHAASAGLSRTRRASPSRRP